MGRGRGKGKRLTAVKSHDPESGGEEVLPSYRRRGRPQKPLKDDLDNDETGRIEEEEDDDDDDDDDVKGGTRRKRPRALHQQTTGRRGRGPSKRKPAEEHPRRAAEAGVECT
ncbi:unnamed protein product [Spirodela intermedia]|uniref:Uncharacterized protein n=1 Tax=Spirodela intermedia TaxID=51605 RepID=A0A7I8JN50_SPIIN|nr:unnamed protein product [Spirodela intermedia]CAA6670892.1 unnamed protein product [Spirodela intermedia]